jgi:hypothetical protein
VQQIQKDKGDIVDQKAVAVDPDGDVVVMWVLEEPTLYMRVMEAG